MNISQYLTNITQLYKLGNATKHIFSKMIFVHTETDRIMKEIDMVEIE